MQKPQVSDLNEIFQRIRDAVYKNGIRTTEFFRDHDKLRSGVITENQVLHTHIHTHTHTNNNEIYVIIPVYRLNQAFEFSNSTKAP